MANKTLKQIADELGISKQRVYRYVKENHIGEAVQDGQAKWYDEAVQNQIKSHFTKNEPHHESHQGHINEAIYDALVKQLEEKDKQIEYLQKALDQEQQLHALAQQKVLLLEQKNEESPRKHWWNFTK